MNTFTQPYHPLAGNASPFEKYRALLRAYLTPQLPRVLLMAFLLLAGIAFQLVNPQVIRYFIDVAQTGGSGAPDKLLRAAGAFLAFALVHQALSVFARYASKVVAWASTNRLRADLTLHLLRLDMAFHKQHTPGELIERIDGDVTQLANFFSQFVIQVLGNGLLIVGILVILFLEDVRIGLAMTVYAAVTLAALGAIQKIAVRRWKDVRQVSADLFSYLEERISGAEEIQVMGAEGYAIRRLSRLMIDFLKKRRAAFAVGSLSYNLTHFVYVIGYAIGLGLGVFLYLQGQVTLSAAYMITFYVGMLSDPLQKLREQAEDFQQSAASISRIQELFSLRPQALDAAPARAGAPRLPGGPLSVAFDRVSFHYDEDPDVLKDIHFDLPAGQVLGVLGRTGSGKSTLTRLLFRLYDPDRGAVRLSDVDLRDVPLAELRRRVGMVTQDVQLFAASLRDNLTFFKPAYDDAHLERVLRELGLWDWVRERPQGLDSVLNAGGQGLSAGEAQLLAFARVFLKEPGLVILDEASSRLDPVTENRMERAIDRLFAGQTGIIIAHRLKTVLRADHILILEEGRVVEFGPRPVLTADPTSRFSHLLQTGMEEVLSA